MDKKFEIILFEDATKDPHPEYLNYYKQISHGNQGIEPHEVKDNRLNSTLIRAVKYVNEYIFDEFDNKYSALRICEVYDIAKNYFKIFAQEGEFEYIWYKIYSLLEYIVYHILECREPSDQECITLFKMFISMINE